MVVLLTVISILLFALLFRVFTSLFRRPTTVLEQPERVYPSWTTQLMRSDVLQLDEMGSWAGKWHVHYCTVAPSRTHVAALAVAWATASRDRNQRAHSHLGRTVRFAHRGGWSRDQLLRDYHVLTAIGA